jgi:FkbM family methyltransferase
MKYLFVYLPKLASALSGGNPLRTVWLYGMLGYFVFTRKVFTKSQPQEFCLKAMYKGREVLYYLYEFINLSSLIEIYVFKEYDWKCGFVPQTILDLGAHFGDTALYYNAVYPGAKIIAVEPDPTNFARLQKNVAAYPNIIPVHCAVGAENGTTRLFLAQNGLGHSTALRKENHGSVEVEQTTVATLLSRYNLEKVDLLKFDIEGAEAALFKDATLTQKSRAFIGELHFDLSSEFTMEDVHERFKDLLVTLEPSLKKQRFIVKAV